MSKKKKTYEDVDLYGAEDLGFARLNDDSANPVYQYSAKETLDKLKALLSGASSSEKPEVGSSEYYHELYNNFSGNEVASEKTGLASWWNSKTGKGLTAAEMANNAFSAWQAAQTREWQTDLANTEVQRRVIDMQKAGVNPALMYGNSSSGASTPSGATASPSSGSTGSFADIAGAVLLPLQAEMMKAQIRNTNVRTEGEGLKNQYQSLVNGYYPTLTEATIDQIRINILGEKATIDLKAAQTAMQNVQTALEEAKLQYKDDYARLLRDYMEAQTDNEKAQKAAALARAAVDNCEANYMAKNHMRMGSNDYVALAEAICGWLGTDSQTVVQTVTKVVKEKAVPVLKRPFEGRFAEGNPKLRAWLDARRDRRKIKVARGGSRE